MFSEQGVEEITLGLYLIRGGSVAVVGLIDQELDEEIDWQHVRAKSLPAI